LSTVLPTPTGALLTVTAGIDTEASHELQVSNGWLLVTAVIATERIIQLWPRLSGFQHLAELSVPPGTT
jgi:hypothetical protein